MRLEGKVQAGSEVQLKATCEQPDNNTRNSKLYATGNGVVALFTGGRSSATAISKLAEAPSKTLGV